MISCTECKNSRCCPLWKSEKINIRTMREREAPINYCLEMVKSNDRTRDPPPRDNICKIKDDEDKYTTDIWIDRGRVSSQE